MYFVFVVVLKVDYGVANSGVYLLLGLVMWSFFAEITGGSVQAVAGKGDLLRKLSFPRYVLVVSTSISAAINMVLSLSVVVLFILISGVEVSWTLVFAPLLIAQLYIFSLGLGFLLSALFVQLRDIGHIWDVIMQLLFYATPIFFPISLAPIWAQKISVLSPLTQAIQDLRYVMVSPNTITVQDVYDGNPYIRIVPVLLTFVSFGLFAWYFRSRSRYFAEEV